MCVKCSELSSTVSTNQIYHALPRLTMRSSMFIIIIIITLVLMLPVIC